ncbi:MAG: hypothetical protein NT027_09430 [Proteobacteria bacterium]|nr:hypothetical protein [Pseudomonadota bacterium]
MTQESSPHLLAFKKFIDAKEGLSKDERELLQVGCAYFIESLLIGGDAERALKAMEANLTSPLPDTSKVTGKKTLRGMVNIEFDPYTTRQYIEYTTSILFDRILTDGDRSTLPWVTQTIKYAFYHEREAPLGYLPTLNLTSEQIHACLKDFVTGVMAQKFEPPANIGDHICHFVQNISRPYWIYTLAKVLSEFSVEELDRYKSIVNTSSLRTRFEPSALESMEGPVDIKPLLDSKCHIFVSQIACAYLLRSQIAATEYKDLIMSRMVGAPYTFIATAANYVSEFQGQFSANDLAILKDVDSMRPPGGGRMFEFSEAHMALRALMENANARLISEPVNVVGGEWTRLKGKFQQIVSVDESTLMLTYIKTKFFAPMSEWRSDEDEIGFLKINKGSMKHFAIPRQFPSCKTGAAGVKRTVFILGKVEGRSEFLIGIQEPFYDERGWGNQNLLFSFNLEGETWSSWIPNPQDKKELIKVSAASQMPVCYGDLKFKVDASGRVTLVEDRTPTYDSYSGPRVEHQLPVFIGATLGRATIVDTVDPLLGNREFREVLETPGFKDRLMNRWTTHGYNIFTLISPWELVIRTRVVESHLH